MNQVMSHVMSHVTSFKCFLVFLERVFQECLTYEGEMDYKTYLDFVLAIEVGFQISLSDWPSTDQSVVQFENH